jgi:TyrR family helix-turn-helix protein
MSAAATELTLRWCIETDDRIGMVRDVVAAIAQVEGNVEAMEVVAQILYIRFRLAPVVRSQLRDRISDIPGVRRIEPIDKLPFETDEERLVKRLMQQDDSVSALSFSNLIYVSPAMKEVVHLAKAAGRGDMPVLITGESGTGKELLARAVHNASTRYDRRFVPLNCAAIPDGLLESELFGYVEGAFTGANRGGRPGMFEVAHGGTLFLDEIGELSPAVQAKLLRVLADGEVRRVGATDSSHVDVRIIAATNRNLSELIQVGQFRADLFYRLHVMPLNLPPLRDRKEDVILLAGQFLERMARKLECEYILTDRAKAALLAYDYPGNVRELQNIIERACYVVEGHCLQPEHLLLPHAAFQPLLVQHEEADLRTMVQSFERKVITQTLDELGSLRAAAKRLGVTHTTLSNKLRKAEVE